MSAPVVSGLAGLLLSAEPGLSANGLRDRIIKSANASRLYDDSINSNGYYPKVAGSSVRVPLLGSGMIDAEKAVKADFSATIASAEALNRVSEGCGQIGLPIGAEISYSILLLLIGLAPLLLRRK